MDRCDTVTILYPYTIDHAIELLGCSVDELETFVNEYSITLYEKITDNLFGVSGRYFKRDQLGNIINSWYCFDGWELYRLFGIIYDLQNIPNLNNSMWLTINDLSKRWSVDESDILARLRQGELHSDRYDNTSKYDFVSPSARYPLGANHEVSFHLAKHIWPYEQKHPALKLSSLEYYNFRADTYGKVAIPWESTPDKSPEVAIWHWPDRSSSPQKGQSGVCETHEAEPSKDKSTKSTDAANLARKRKNARTLVEKIGEAAKLAHAITSEGPQRGGLPWSEEEIKAKAKELGLSLKGEALKAFKAGMPPDLVKQTRGARPSSPPDNSPASSEEFPDFVGSED